MMTDQQAIDLFRKTGIATIYPSHAWLGVIGYPQTGAVRDVQATMAKWWNVCQAADRPMCRCVLSRVNLPKTIGPAFVQYQFTMTVPASKAYRPLAIAVKSLEIGNDQTDLINRGSNYEYWRAHITALVYWTDDGTRASTPGDEARRWQAINLLMTLARSPLGQQHFPHI